MTGERVDVVIIGGGVIGAAVARRLSARNLSLVVLEAHERIAEGVTSRNSGVIHSGLYYPPESLKARLCVRGLELLYDWAARHGVAHAQVAKVILATTPAEEEELENIFRNALASGATGLERWGSSRIANALPSVRGGSSAMFASRTGIIDPFELTRSLLVAAEENGALVLTSAKVERIEPLADGCLVHSTRGLIAASLVVNAAGLRADEIAAMAGVAKYRIFPCRGDYFRLHSRERYPHLVYPVKAKGDPGLGIHLTLDLSGGLRLGPDTEFVDAKDDFSSRPEKLEKFRKAAEKLLGPLKPEQLSYDQCGIRPKLRSPSEPAEKDFIIARDLPWMINLVGIESPGLTASLAIAEMVETLL